jgi:hypothetical protein
MKSTKPYVLTAFLIGTAISSVREFFPRLWKKVLGSPFIGGQAFEELLDEDMEPDVLDKPAPSFSRRTGLIRRNRLKRRYYVRRAVSERREPSEPSWQSGYWLCKWCGITSSPTSEEALVRPHEVYKDCPECDKEDGCTWQDAS